MGFFHNKILRNGRINMVKSFKDIRNYNLRTLKTVEDFNWNGPEKPEEYLETKFKVLELKNKKIIFLVTDFVALLFLQYAW